MQIEKFEDIVAWKKSKELTVWVYKNFRELKDFSFKNQIERASVSIMNILQKVLKGREIKNYNIFYL